MQLQESFDACQGLISTLVAERNFESQSFVWLDAGCIANGQSKTQWNMKLGDEQSDGGFYTFHLQIDSKLTTPMAVPGSDI